MAKGDPFTAKCRDCEQPVRWIPKVAGDPDSAYNRPVNVSDGAPHNCSQKSSTAGGRQPRQQKQYGRSEQEQHDMRWESCFKTAVEHGNVHDYTEDQVIAFAEKLVARIERDRPKS